MRLPAEALKRRAPLPRARVRWIKKGGRRCECHRQYTLDLSRWRDSPFGKEIKTTKRGHGIISTLLNVIWILFAGLAIALTHVVLGLLCAVTIVGIPFAKQHMKLASLALTPFGHTYE